MNPLKKLTAVIAVLVFCLLLSSSNLFNFTLPSWREGNAEVVGKVLSASADDSALQSQPSSGGEDSRSPEQTVEVSQISVLGVSYPSDTSSLTLKLRSSDVSSVLSALSSFSNLAHLNIPENTGDPSSFTVDDFIALSKALPQTEIDCTFDLFGQRVNTVTTTRLEYLQTPIGEFGFDIFWKLLPYLHHLSYLSFDRCDIPDEACASLRDAFPDTEIVWRVFFSPFSCMTDIETIWASVDLRDETCSSLKYCTKVKYFDVGHNLALSDFSFLRYMPELEVAILSVTGLSDLSQLAECENLEYLEICNCTRDMDVSPLASLKHLHHLNMNYLGYVTGAEALCELTELERLWIGGMTYLDDETLAQIREALPNTEIDVEDTTGCSGTWRFTADGGLTERYALLKQQFDYDRYPYSCSSYTADPRYYYRN